MKAGSRWLDEKIDNVHPGAGIELMNGFAEPFKKTVELR